MRYVNKAKPTNYLLLFFLLYGMGILIRLFCVWLNPSWAETISTFEVMVTMGFITIFITLGDIRHNL